MRIIGLTGGIGTGKSTVARFLAELGATVIDVDEVGHQSLKPSCAAFHDIVTAFGKQILSPDGEINRAELGKIVFKNEATRKKLNGIIHPAMYEIVKKQIAEYRRQGVGIVVLDAPLLLDAGWGSLVNDVWVTVAREKTVLHRLQKRSGLSPAEVKARIRAQLPAVEKVKHATAVIDTEGTLQELKSKVAGKWRKLQDSS
ncbi:dephospho-CoA kinase [Chloroflexota bacterium]